MRIGILLGVVCFTLGAPASAQYRIEIEKSRAGPFAPNYKTREAAISNFETKCKTWPDAIGRVIESSSGESVRVDCIAVMERIRAAKAERLTREKSQRELQQRYQVFAQSSTGVWRSTGGYPTEQTARAAAERQCIDRVTPPKNLASKFVDPAGQEIVFSCATKR
ncbi:hypothetical protein [Achromobacter sp. GbtcB20]|uniref:hypothetical protein n=1 Tax=Achromobacter sp. GbtcB20 TaxID=2824765 RepID=UPI001C2F65C1|nr:hypothetical protein [Achromobacter sp. GbtcB20]